MSFEGDGKDAVFVSRDAEITNSRNDFRSFRAQGNLKEFSSWAKFVYPDPLRPVRRIRPH